MVNAMNYYSSQDSHLVAVDCIILGFSDNEMDSLCTIAQWSCYRRPFVEGWFCKKE
jgi:hypothetical protein